MTDPASRQPVVFFGHGSPMNALQDNDSTRTWAKIAAGIGKPRAILCISAHWLTRGIGVTAMAAPRTIHDFGNFPKALFEVEYPAPGDPALARRVRDLLAPNPVILDESSWGLDHGSWSVLCKAWPEADVPVVQLSLNAQLGPQGHFDLGRRLRPLRDEGVLIMGSGNIVHNLQRMQSDASDREGLPWARRFNDQIRAAIRDNRPDRAIDFASLGEDAALSVPTPEHYWPLLYVLGARDDGDAAFLGPDHIEYGSLSMTSVVLRDPGGALA